ncbi:amidohydrolase family protein [Desulfosporosinus shakirovi]|uniref:amidohydrolase family protein n=1 Tax=Desulfosporosinus shakirovi TaxID=2885154 RepID=UPI001E28C172|nr:amidohydrolase family protein [Desulfosporosinus sp. SRJS8]MCB8817112.1 amidohydrolase family protein [Desulfosporosinus sp. SRJS8]
MTLEFTDKKSPKPRIDFHVHMGLYTYSHPWVTDWIKQVHSQGYEDYINSYNDPGAFEGLLSSEGVDYACVLAELSYITTGICTNEQVRDFCRGRSKLIPFCDINPHIFTNLGDELRHKVEDEGFRGLKLYPTYQHYYLNDQRMYPLYQAAQDLGIPVLIHTGSSVFKGSRMKYGDPLHLDDVAGDFPNLNLVMAHSGRGFWYEKAFFLSKLHSNLYMELAGLPPGKLLTYFPELARNTDKVIFGSDWPGMRGIKSNMEAISKLALPAEGVGNILGGNAARLLRL